MSNRRILTIISILSLVIAIVIGSLILRIAFGHNSQGEFYDPETFDVNVGHSTLLFLASFVPAFVATWIAGLLLFGIWGLLLRLPGERYTAIAIMCCVVGAVLLLAYGPGKDFWSIDDCLDRGGRWNYETRVCEYE